MGRHKAGEPARGPIRQILALRGVDAWRAWLEELANRQGLSSSALVDEALAEWAAKRGYPPPPGRTGEKE